MELWKLVRGTSLFMLHKMFPVFETQSVILFIRKSDDIYSYLSFASQYTMLQNRWIFGYFLLFILLEFENDNACNIRN